jgi:hypothetical protein
MQNIVNPNDIRWNAKLCCNLFVASPTCAEESTILIYTNRINNQANSRSKKVPYTVSRDWYPRNRYLNRNLGAKR